MRRVVITGMGAVTPLGLSAEESWRRLCEGCTGIAPVNAFDASGLRTRVAGEVKDFEPEAFTDPRTARRVDRFIQLGIAAARMAIADAGLATGTSGKGSPRLGVVMGNCLGGVLQLEQGCEAAANGAGTRLSPYFIVGMLPNSVASFISIETGAKGPCLTVSQACASGSVSIGIAKEWISSGRADAVIAGGCEAAISRVTFCGYHALKATTARNEEPERASRPFDRERDGFVPAEGAGAVVLESLESARRRGATIMAEVAGYATTSDAFHPTQPDPSAEGQARCMSEALRDAHLRPEEVDCLNAHGTSTRANDMTETRAIRAVFGAAAEKIPVTSNKSMIGHMIGAAGAVEAVFSVLSMRDGVIPPTINYEHPDPECDLDYVPNVPRRAELLTVLSNSFGFGGINACLVFRRF